MKITAGTGRKSPAPETVPDPDLVTRFLTLGGAVTELRHHVFKTNYWAGPHTYHEDGQEVNGFRWACLGCGQVSRFDSYDPRYLGTEADEARDDANEHASRCRAMPVPMALIRPLRRWRKR